MWLSAFAHRIIFLLPVSSGLESNALGAGSRAGSTGRIGTSPIWHHLLGSLVAVRIKLYFTDAACQDQCTALLPTPHVVQSEIFFFFLSMTTQQCRGLLPLLLGPQANPPDAAEGFTAHSSIFSCTSSERFRQFKFTLASLSVAPPPNILLPHDN